jgi:hypothetical protein
LSRVEHQSLRQAPFIINARQCAPASSILVVVVYKKLFLTLPASHQFLLLSKTKSSFHQLKKGSVFLIFLKNLFHFLFINWIIDANKIKKKRDLQKTCLKERSRLLTRTERRGSFVSRILWRFALARARQGKREGDAHTYSHTRERGEREKLSRPKLRPVSRPVDSVRATTDNSSFSYFSRVYLLYTRPIGVLGCVFSELINKFKTKIPNKKSK